MDYGYAIPHLKLDPTLTYRIRAINFGTLAGISLSFQNHHVEVITVDGGLEVKKTSREAQSLGILHSGQRVDFILRPRDTQLQQSGFTINLDREDFRYANPAMISEQAYPIIPPSSDSPTAAENSTSLPPLIDIPSTNHTDLSALSSSDKITQAIPEKVDETYMVYVNVMKKSINAFKPYSYMNHTSWLPQSDPRVPLLGLPREEWDKHQLSIITSGNRKNERKGERWVDLVVNNLNEGSHPFHMHGHDFHVISTHQSALKFGSYNPFEPIPPSADFTGPPYDVSVSLARDTVLVPFHGHVVLRFKADNPGLWMFHCHVMWHLSG
ncbi:Carboxy-terminal domain (CTD) phosphatase, partial [Ascosphaera pollenicola]